MAQTKIEQGLLKFTEATDYLKIPTGTTAQRPSSPAAGYIRFNTTISAIETYDGTEWVEIGVTPPTFSSVDYPGSATALDPAGGESLVINGTAFNVGITVTIDGTTPSSITRNSENQLTVTAPAKTAGTYSIVFTNTDGGTATAINAVSYNGIPAFTNAAGSLGSVKDGNAINFSVAATEPDGGAITYAITSGSLPSGATLNTTTGAITGTAPSVNADTTSNFTITATDNENQTASRAYSITIEPLLPSDSFQVVTYTGDGTTSHSITGVGFQPDFIWLKNRDLTENHSIYDNSRTLGNPIYPNLTNAQAGAVHISSFNSDGFTLGTTNHNENGSDYVAWCWKLNGGTTSSNTDGSITSTVQVNDAAGFSIIKFTGTGAQGTIGHGLSAAPELIFSKRLDSANNWTVYQKDLSLSHSTYPNWLYLNANSSEQNSVSSANHPYYQAPSSTLIYQNTGTSETSNVNGGEYISYCFASVAGSSKIGSYTGTGTTGNAQVCGFEPAFLLAKRISSTSDWYIIDNKRNTTNPRNNFINANASDVEYSPTYGVTFNSNGFTFISTDLNGTGQDWIYMAFAADPDTTAPTLADSFNTKLYTGSGGTQSITGLGFKPNLVWIKNRTTTASHLSHDSVRGTGSTKTLFPNNTPIQGSLTTYGWIDSFDANGFTVNASSNGHHSNRNGDSYVAWAWKADDNEPTINTDGSSNSTVSVNSNAGFSIVSYVGNQTAGHTIGHGLSVKPDMIIIKCLNVARPWYVYHVGVDASNPSHYNLRLNETDVRQDSTTEFNDTEPTSTVFTLGTASGPNGSGDNYIAYCFHSVSGFSKFGSYSGNNTGQTITTGFQPDFLMLKKTNIASGWWIMDSVRGTTNNVQANTDSVESTGISGAPTFVSTGFNFSGSTFNETGVDWIYMAFKIN